jgi:hypothetical protein
MPAIAGYGIEADALLLVLCAVGDESSLSALIESRRCRRSNASLDFVRRSGGSAPNAPLGYRLSTLGLRLEGALGDLEADLLVVGHLGQVGLLEGESSLDEGSFGAQMIAPKVRTAMSQPNKLSQGEMGEHQV